MRTHFFAKAVSEEAFFEAEAMARKSQHYGSEVLQPAATRCNALQHTATHCNMLQHSATHFRKSCRTYERVLSLMHLSHGPHIYEACLTCECVMSHM